MAFWLAIAVVVCAVAGAIAYAVRPASRARVHAASPLKQQTLEMAVPTVTVIHPKRGAAAEEVVLPGNAQAYVATPIYARTNGYLKTWYFDIGAHVKAGQLLAEIETPEVDRQLDQARADLATAQANYDLAQTTAARYQSLFKSDSVAKQDVDDRVGDLQAKKAMVDSATFNVRRLEETQRFQKVYAPFDGVITARNIDIGALINAGSNAPGKELFDIAATAQAARLHQRAAAVLARRARPAAHAELTLAEFPGRRFAGKIVRTLRLHRSGIAHAADGSGRRQSDRRVAARRVSLGASQAEFPGRRRDRAGQRADFPLRRHAGGRGSGRQGGVGADYHRPRLRHRGGSAFRRHPAGRDHRESFRLADVRHRGAAGEGGGEVMRALGTLGKPVGRRKRLPHAACAAACACEVGQAGPEGTPPANPEPQRRSTLALLAACALLLAGCTVGPKYTRPAVPAAPAFSEQPPKSFTESAGWKQAQPADTTLRTDWWQIFGNSELNGLEEQINLSNQTLKAAEARFREARALIQLNRSGLYPTISTAPSISTNRTSTNSPTGGPRADYGDYMLPIDVNYELDAWGRVRRSIAAAREETQASAGDLETIRLSLHAELAIDYFELRSLDAQKQLLDETLVAYQKALDLTQNRFDGGLSSRAEVAQARTQLETTRAQDIGVGVARASFEHAIAILMGRTPESLTLAAVPLGHRAAGDSCGHPIAASGAPPGHRRRRAPRGRGQRTDRHRPRGLFPAVAAHGDGRF